MCPFQVRKRRSHSDDEEGFEYSTGNPISALSVECFASHSQLGDDRITYTHFVELLCEFNDWGSSRTAMLLYVIDIAV